MWHFISSWVGSVYLKLGFVWGWGWFYFEFLGNYFFLRELFLFIFLLFCGGTLLIFV